MKGQVDDQVAQTRGLFLGSLIPHDLNANHQSTASNIADDLEFLCPIREAPENVVAHALGIFLVLALDQIHRGQRRRNANRISAERRAVSAGLPAHHALSCDDRAEWHAARNTLSGTKNVRFDSGVFTGPPLPGTSHTRLHFVHDEQDAVLPADALQFLQKELRCGHVPAFALNGLNDDARDVLGIEQTLENLPFELFEDFRAAGLRGVAVRAAIRAPIDRPWKQP